MLSSANEVYAFMAKIFNWVLGSTFTAPNRGGTSISISMSASSSTREAVDFEDCLKLQTIASVPLLAIDSAVLNPSLAIDFVADSSQVRSVFSDESYVKDFFCSSLT